MKYKEENPDLHFLPLCVIMKRRTMLIIRYLKQIHRRHNMIDKEIGEIRRHMRRDRSNMTAIFGCYVNDNKEIISQFRQSTGMMPENESDKYFALLRRTLSGAIGRNLIDITFKTSQVASSPEHKLLMGLRESKLEDEELRGEFFRKIIDSLVIEGNYLILAGYDAYDVPFKSKDDAFQKDNSDETYSFLILLFAVCILGYLWYNATPSKLMMGDAGSRAMGIFISIAALKSGSPLLYIPVALVLILDGGLGLVKVTLIRVCKIHIMKNIRTPLHDHVRKVSGWSNTQTVFRFAIIQIVLSAAVIYGIR